MATLRRENSGCAGVLWTLLLADQPPPPSVPVSRDNSPQPEYNTSNFHGSNSSTASLSGLNNLPALSNHHINEQSDQGENTVL
jgi:hypothetical protein